MSTYHAQIYALINNNHLREAIAKLRFLCSRLGYPELSSRLDSLEETYRYMLKYIIEGKDDNQRDAIYSDLKISLHAINDAVLRNSSIRNSTELYYETIRTDSINPESLNDLFDKFDSNEAVLSLAEYSDNDPSAYYREREKLLEKIFNSVWTSAVNKDTLETLTHRLHGDVKFSDINAQIISAATLALLQYYDHGILDLLLTVYENSSDSVIKARALCAIVLTIQQYPQIINSDYKIMMRLQGWQDNIILYQQLRQVVTSIIRTRDTQRVISKVNNEVIPDIMKMRPDIMDKMRNGSIDFDNMDPENNPEWEEMLEKSGLNDKMRELTEMQTEGADIMMIAFSNLKNFPFFNHISHWFLPFNSNNSAICSSPEIAKLINVLLTIGNFACDSDKYSMALAFAQMPVPQRDMMVSQLTAQVNQFSDEISERALKSSDTKFDDEVVCVLRDLYRFYNLFRKKKDFKDPFDRPLDFAKLPGIGSILDEEDLTSVVGEFYFKHEYYREALPVLEKLGNSDNPDASVWEKIGFCHSMLGAPNKALESYSKAELLHKPGTWLIRQLAIVNRRLHRFDESANYYRLLLDSEPDNVNTLMGLASVLLQNKQIEEAVHHYNHARYIAPDDMRITRALAWAELLNGRYDKSEELYAMLLLADARDTDYLNAGHSALLRGEYKKASTLYGRALEMQLSDVDPLDIKSRNKAVAAFETIFANDKPLLLEHGADAVIVDLILDNLKYNK